MLGQDTEFYPSTPLVASAIKEALWSYKGGDKPRILDPSAGNGVLLKAIEDSYRWRQAEFFAIEIDPELRSILWGHDFKVLDSDWLEYRELETFDIIVMNPPFSDGIHHILKAWDYVAEGGLLVSVVPDTMLDRGNSYKERLANLVDGYGSTKSIGRAFLEGYRRTDVNCSIITLNKPKATAKDWFKDLELDTSTPALGADFADNPLAHPDQIETLVRQYELVCKYAIKQYQAERKYKYYMRGIGSSYETEDGGSREINKRLASIKSNFWHTVFEQTKVGSSTTSAFKKQFQQGVGRSSSLAFTKKNIIEVLSIFFLNRGEIMQQCIDDVFDKATRYHEKNIVHHEGWKSNKSSKIAEKIIIPDRSLYHEVLGWTRFYSGDRFCTFADDFDKALCWVTGLNYDDPRLIKTVSAINDFVGKVGKNGDYQQEFTSTFFKIRIFKKGTIHLVFKDRHIRDAFNRAAAQGKHAIGADY